VATDRSSAVDTRRDVVKRYLKRWHVLAAIVVLAIAITMLVATPALAGGKVNVLPAHGLLYGKTLGQWLATWWTWELSYPVDHNPALDDTGALANLGQHGKVFMLAGDFAGNGPTRHFCVAYGKALLVNVIGVEASTLEDPPFYGGNYCQLRAAVEDSLFDFGTLVATVDGVPIPHLRHYCVESPLYRFHVPANNALGVDPGCGKSVARACIFMLAPLPKGRHVIHVYGEFPNLSYSEQTTYVIWVK
jgi:hypothetical protein